MTERISDPFKRRVRPSPAEVRRRISVQLAHLPSSVPAVDEGRGQPSSAPLVGTEAPVSATGAAGSRDTASRGPALSS